jgi:hypothetical protein
MKKLLSSTLQNSTWSEANERDNAKRWMKEIGERVKERMLEVQPRGLCVFFKKICLQTSAEQWTHLLW